MKESIQSLGYAMRLVEALERQEPGAMASLVWVRAPWGQLAAGHCARWGERTGGLRLLVRMDKPKVPWRMGSREQRIYLRCGWNTRTLSRAIFRALQAAPLTRPRVLELWRRVEEEGPLPIDWVERVDVEVERSGRNPIYDTMTDIEAEEWMVFLDQILTGGGAVKETG